MVSKLRSFSGNTKASPLVIAVSVIALLAFISWQAYINLFAPPKPAPFDAQGLKNRSVLAALAKKCHGKMGLLSPEDQATAHKLAGGYAGMAIALLYKDPNLGD